MGSGGWDDVIYLSLLLMSIALGPQIRRLKDPVVRQRVSALAGFLAVALVSGRATWHPIVLVLINGTITLYASKRFCHTLSFIFGFGYLAFFRFCHNFGGAFSVPPPPHTNAVLMILTLKMIGLTFEVRETYFRKKKTKITEAESLESQYLNVDPSWMDIFYYSFCHAGVFTGPYFRYRTYWDSLHKPYAQYANITDSLIRRIRVVPLYAILFLIFGSIFPQEYATSDEIFQRPMWYRVWYMSPMFFVFRMRIYIAFVLSECQCITSGIGVYPSESGPKSGQGPIDFTVLNKLDNDKSLLAAAHYDYETIHNIDEYGTEFGRSARDALRGWNMTVQYWLVIYVFKRVPWKKYRVAITMLTSAFWHGVYPGYYLSFLIVPALLLVEDELSKALHRPDASVIQEQIYHVLGNIFKLQAFSYIAIGFFLLTTSSTLNYWISIYFIGHVALAILYVISRTMNVINKRRNYDSSCKESNRPSGTKSH